MKTLFVCSCVAVLIASLCLHAQESSTAPVLQESHRDVPWVFEPNRGQANDDVRFLSRGSGYTVLLGSDKTVLLVPPDPSAVDRMERPQPAVVTLELVDSDRNANVEGLDLLPGTSNYYIGKQRANWVTGVPQYSRVRVKSIYSGIDLVYYGNQGQLEYDFVLSPGVDPRVLSFKVNGAQEVNVDGSGNLRLRVAKEMIEIQKPTIYQESEGGVRRAIAGHLVLRGNNEVTFQIGDYDRHKPLIIDPALSFSSLIGANNSTQVQGVAVDSSGNMYITGTTFATNYPVLHAFQSTNRGYTNVFVTKLNPAGGVILYSTYIGSSGFDTGRAIAVVSFGSAYITGNIGAEDFPTTPGAFMTTCPSICNTPFV